MRFSGRGVYIKTSPKKGNELGPVIARQFYDDFDDYGIEMEFENELRRLTEVEEDESNGARSGGQESGYPGSDLRPRVYVGGGDYGEDMDFHYPSDFDY